MEQWVAIRRRVLVEQVSQRQISRETGMHWRSDLSDSRLETHESAINNLMRCRNTPLLLINCCHTGHRVDRQFLFGDPQTDRFTDRPGRR